MCFNLLLKVLQILNFSNCAKNSKKNVKKRSHKTAQNVFGFYDKNDLFHQIYSFSNDSSTDTKIIVSAQFMLAHSIS